MMTDEIDDTFEEFILGVPRGVASAPPDLPTAEAEAKINRAFDAECADGAGQRHEWMNRTAQRMRIEFSFPDPKRKNLNAAPIALVIPSGASVRLHPTCGRVFHRIVGGERVGQPGGMFIIGGLAPLLERISPPQRAVVHPSLISTREAAHG